MTQLCVAIFVHDLAQARADISQAAEAGADLVELRVDLMTDLDELTRLVDACLLPCIVTCRPEWEGGLSHLPHEQRLELLMQAAMAGASYIDIELNAKHRGGSLQSQTDALPRERRPGLIVSNHDFKTRPAKLTSVVDEINRSSADVTKIVWTARTVRDNLEAFELLLHKSKPTIALCMGEAGLISRVLGKKFGAFLTFASLRNESATAPGQVTVDDMKRLYRWDAQNAHTRVYGVVGSPIMHSMSPAIHNAAFERVGHDGVYVPLLVNEGYESFKAFMETFLAFEPLHLSGLSITIPHKENALRYLREFSGEATIEPLAERIGALNTIVIDRSTGAVKLRGFSSDYAAILDSITARLGISREDLNGKRVAVLGAGGTGRTAVAALAHYGATVVVYNRTRERADALAAEFDGKTGKVVSASFEKLCDSCCEIFINTTSVGMHPNTDASPFGDAPQAFDANTLVFDTIYNPMKTKLLAHAESRGAKTIGGVEMFVRQAAAQFEAWTEKPAPLELMRKVVEARLTTKL